MLNPIIIKNGYFNNINTFKYLFYYNLKTKAYLKCNSQYLCVCFTASKLLAKVSNPIINSTFNNEERR